MNERYEQLIETLLKSEQLEVVAAAQHLAERWRYEQAWEQGKRQSLEYAILRVLQRRFNQSAADIPNRLAQLTVETLELAFEEALIAFDLADFDQRLKRLEG